ncbi:hypothetical protein GCM10008171_27060 [Methylopila jiangsuensis]|uniref:Uncharacterized protein n=1 Tax=Methylopila jiangsuensis TaxID=586230 RepID=A0A9W6JI34_9HYPH|nr:hypothetical protein [Methylopila jiangsuensis]GLK77452.1 hypothetical protein GCM10008171_27060 [Methylopila jiangsuensis]
MPACDGGDPSGEPQRLRPARLRNAARVEARPGSIGEDQETAVPDAKPLIHVGALDDDAWNASAPLLGRRAAKLSFNIAGEIR